jgi:signal transduction histidine kinase
MIVVLQLLVSIYLVIIVFIKSLGHISKMKVLKEIFTPLIFSCFHFFSTLAFLLSVKLPLAVYGANLIIVIAYGVIVAIKDLGKAKISPSSSIEAMENLPMGLSFTTKEGFPLLTNRRMYLLVKAITGEFYLNGKEFWGSVSNNNTVVRPLVSLDNGRKWQFSKKELRHKGYSYIQITAIDVTQLYQLTKELDERNNALDIQYERLERLSEEIEEIKREEQVLASKIRIHDSLGQNILLGNLLLEKAKKKDIIREDLDLIIQNWVSLSRQLSGEGELQSEEKDVYLVQLGEMAKALGVRVEILGDFPADGIEAHLIFAALREALSNAVRHGQADLVTVNLSKGDDEVTVIITDNGKGHQGKIDEKGGLKNLRKKIELAGGEIDIEAGERFRIRINVPVSGVGNILW